MRAENLKFWLKKFWRSQWLFLVVIALPVILLSSLKISGTSIGSYNALLFAPGHQDPNLIYGQPRGIRSDEWLVNTQMTIAQAKAGFPRINRNIGNGQDMSLVLDVPYKDWSTLFKAQNLAFFVMPLEYAFAFRWWLVAFLLLASCYLLVLSLLPGKRLLAALISLALFMSPFVQWWYAYGTLGSIYYSLFIAAVMIKLIQSRSSRTRLLLSSVLIYLLTSLALVLYPPYQIPCALAVGVLFLGYLLECNWRKDRPELFKSLYYMIGSAAVAGLIVLAFLETRSGAIHIITHTVYPGVRDITSGGLNPLHFFGNQLSPLLQSDRRGANYFSNQSEAAGFIFVFPFLLIISTYFLLSRRRGKPFDWPLLTVNLALLVLVARATIKAKLFLRLLGPFFKLFLLNQVQNERLMIGVGLLAFFQIILLIRHWQRFRPKLNLVAVVLTTISTLTVFLYSGVYVHRTYPIFLNSRKLLLAAALAMTLIVFLFSIYKFTWGMVVLVSFSLLSVYKVNPLYRGLGEPLHGALANAIQRNNRPQATWIQTDLLIDENFPLDQAARSFGGVQAYPQLSLWHQADPKQTKQYMDNLYVYNRYSHIYFHLMDEGNVSFSLTGPDNFRVNINPCGNFAANNDIKYVLAVAPASNSCLSLTDKISYPNFNFYIYRINY